MSESGSVDWKVVEGVLPAGWRQMAAQRKLVRPNLPKHMGTVVTDIGQILRLVLYQVGRNVGLQTAAAAFAAAGLLEISSVALHKWMKKLGPYLAELVAAMVSGSHGVFAAERWAGYEIVAVDATCVQRPGATGTTARVHRALRLVDLRVLRAVVTDQTGGETFRRFVPEAGQLWLGDRAYANPPGIAWVKDHKGEVLVRYNRGSLPLYDARGIEVDVLSKLAKLRKPGWSRQWQAFVHTAGDDRIEGRLCAVRLPADKAEQARERLRREQGTGLTQESLAMADFVVVFTTVPSSRLALEQVLEIYRMRWQIELDFKRDKSITGLDRLPNFLPNTIESWIYAKLLLHQVLRSLANQNVAIPPCASEFADAICTGCGSKRAA
jgi:hypothetical protein